MPPFFNTLLWAAAAALSISATASASPSRRTTDKCTPSTFTFPDIPGASLVSFSAVPVHSWKPATLGFAPEVQGTALPAGGISLCNVTVTYTHGSTDAKHRINTHVWLPLEPSTTSTNSSSHTPWNGRFIGVAGGGFSTGDPNSAVMALHVHRGFAAATTDGGHQNPSMDASWVLSSPGNLDWELLVDYSYRALHEMAVIGKSVTTEYHHGRHPHRAYFVGCSTGGRQGLLHAQRYPEDYDGILAANPSKTLGGLAMSFYWPHLVMNRLGVYPPPCQLAGIERAAVRACDGLDGQTDGVVGEFERCDFDPESVVGQTVDCASFPSANWTGTQTISAEAVKVVKAMWGGAVHDDGERLWYPFPVGTPVQSVVGVGTTVCDSNHQNCRGNPVPLATMFLKYFWQKNATYDPLTLTIDQFREGFRDNQLDYDGILGWNSTDLSRFRRAGGKLITYHGAFDELVPLQSTRDYYAGVADRFGSPEADKFYRHFEIPGTRHCMGPPGSAYPVQALEQLQRWVEHGVAPDFLVGNVIGPNMAPVTGKERKICKFPAKADFNGGNPDDLSSYTCSAA